MTADDRWEEIPPGMNLWERCGDDRPGETGAVRRWIGCVEERGGGEEEEKRRRGGSTNSWSVTYKAVYAERD